MDANAAYRFVAVLQDELFREAAETSLRAQHARQRAE